MQLHDRLLGERNRLGLTQQEMAEAAGVQKRAYIYYEKGERIPDAECLKKLLDAKVDVMYLLSGVSAEQRARTASRPAVSAADAVAIVVELLNELDLQSKLVTEQVRILASWIVEQKATKLEAKAFLQSALKLSALTPASPKDRR